MKDKLIDVDFKDLDVGENSRGVYEGISTLMKSIKSEGLLQNPLVRKKGKTGYKLLAGARRVEACKKLGWASIPCKLRVVNDDLNTKADDLIVNYTENAQRLDITEYEKGKFINALMEEESMSKQEVCARLDIKHHEYKVLMSIFADTPRQYRKDVIHMPPGTASGSGKYVGKISIGCAKAINDLYKRNALPKKIQLELYQKAKKHEISTREVKSIEAKIRQGMPFEKALGGGEYSKIKTVTLQLKMTEADYSYVYKKGNPPDVIREYLYGEGKLKKLKRPVV